ncbi:MAG: 16S rRNA (uracil(1498)-N(3))-methyltransferase [Bacteroidetes bacterium]|nr:16S rRNA (uracil(1498)-N(3))-methyltransferase [Bacteroidota bacterium]
MHLFYTPHITGDTLVLDEQESKHAIRVLRLETGDTVILIDGVGGWYEAVIHDDHPKRCLLVVSSHTENYKPLPYHLHIAISPTKNMDRFEWFLEKATEIGISKVTPLMCHRTERKQVKMDRLDRILVSAMKQSLKAFKPVLSEPVQVEEFLKQEQTGTLGIAHCYPLDRISLPDLERSGRYTILVGPEGDFTEEELALAIKARYRPLHLGESRLRTETAGVHISSAIQVISGISPVN